MFSCQIVDDENPKVNNLKLNNSVSQKDQQVESRRGSAVGNNSANSFSSTGTTSSTSSAYKTSVVASVSMSLERKNSIEYIVNPSSLQRGPVPACIIPPGQNTVLHFDNYTEFLAQRVTTTTAVQTSAKICSEVVTTTKQLGGGEVNYSPAPSSTTGVSGNSALDINFQVIFGGSAKNQINKKTLTMHKKKMLASKRRESLAIDSYIMPPPPIPLEQMPKPEPSTKLKSILKKPKKPRQKKGPNTNPTPKQKKQAPQKKAAGTQQKRLVPATNEDLDLKMSSFAKTDEPNKILKPCFNLLQDRKCPYQLTCQYLHSEFPCKYYYCNLNCPDGAKCSFLHNGQLLPELKSALQCYISDLLADEGKSASVTECMFIHQIRNVDYMKIINESQYKCITSGEIVEVLDDEDNEQMLVIDESIEKMNENDTGTSKFSPSYNALQNSQHFQQDCDRLKIPQPRSPLQNAQSFQQVLALVPQNTQFDAAFKTHKEVNNVLCKIEDNLEKLRTDTSKSAKAKNGELNNMYELLNRQKELVNQSTTNILRNNKNTMDSMILNKIPVEQTSVDDEQTHIVLVDPDIVNDIQTANSQDSLITITVDDDDDGDNFEENNYNGVTISEEPQLDGIETNASDVLPQSTSDIEDISTLQKENEIVDDNTLFLQYEELPEQQESTIRSNVLEKENGENITNMPISIQEIIDKNNITIWKILKTNPPEENTESTAKVSTLQQPENLIDNEKLEENHQIISTTKITNPPKDENIKILNSQQEEEMETNNLILNCDYEKMLQPNEKMSQNSNTLDIENLTDIENTESISKTLTSEKQEIIDNGRKINVDHEELQQCYEIIYKISPTKTTHPSEVENIELISKNSTLLREEEKIIDNQVTLLCLDNDGPQQNNNKKISPTKNSNPSENGNTEFSSKNSASFQKDEEIKDNDTPQQNIQTITEISSTQNSDLLYEKNSETISTLCLDNKNPQQYNETISNSSKDEETFTLDMAISSDEKEIIEGNDDEESPAYEKITSTIKRSSTPKTLPRASSRSRIRLRSHTLQVNEEINFKANSPQFKPTATFELPAKTPIKLRRLRLPKPTTKVITKTSNSECKIDADVINKLTDETKQKSTILQDLEAPLTENVIISNRFLKKTEARLEQKLKASIKTKEYVVDNESIVKDVDKNIELHMFALHNDNKQTLNNFELAYCTQTSSDGSQSLNPSQDPLIVENDLTTSRYCEENAKAVEPIETESNSNHFVKSPTCVDNHDNHLKRRVCYENTSSSSATAEKQQFILGQKRHSLTPESNLDSSLKADKISKVENTKCIRKVNLRRQHLSLGQSSSDDFNTDSSDEKPTKADALQSSSPTGNTQAFKPSTSTHDVTTQHHHDEQQQENESDLRQQIENVSNKSDLQLQSQQLQLQQQDEIETTTTTTTFTKNSNDLPHKQQKQTQEQQHQIENEKIANTCNPYGNVQKVADKVHEQQQQIDENGGKPTLHASNKYSNEPISPAIVNLDIKVGENAEYCKYSSLYNKLSSHTVRRQINFENSSVHITPMASPTYVGGDNTIASPSPVREEEGSAFDYRMGGEIDGRMTYPPMRFILREIDLGKTEINKPSSIEKLTKTTHLDPRIFRTHVKKPMMSHSQPITQTPQAVVPLTYSANSSALSLPSTAAYPATSISPYDPRSRTTAMMPTPTSSNQSALSCYNINPTTALVPYSDVHTPAVGVPLQHYQTPLVHHQTPQPPQQTPNMLLYGCLQRSPWYQSLMSTMKIQINQSISQLVRAINNFQRERLLNPEIVFDIFKIDIGGELLEIMRNLGIFIDANGIINEQRHVGGRPLNTATSIPVNATYSFIQQVLTPTPIGGTSMMTTASSSTYNAATAAAINANEPFVSCYIEAPKMVQNKHQPDEDMMSAPSPQYDNNSNGNNNYNQRRYNNQFKKPYDNNSQHNSQQRGGSYNQNQRFNKSYQNSDSNSPARTSPQHHSPRDNGGGGGGGGRGGGRGGRFNNNNKRFNNNASSWSSSSSPPPHGNSFNNRNNRSFNSNNSPTKSSSPPQTYGEYRNSSNTNNSSSPPPVSSQQKSPTRQSSPPPRSLPNNNANADEEDWD